MSNQDKERMQKLAEESREKLILQGKVQRHIAATKQPKSEAAIAAEKFAEEARQTPERKIPTNKFGEKRPR